MSERKVLNKYYPPDFDPSKIPRMKLPKNRQYTVRLMAPFNMRCATCGEYIYKGKKFNARKEDVENEDYLGIRIYRFYIKCTRCLQEISFKTDPKNTDYEIEAGATRNFMALKLAEEQAQREEEEAKEEEASNPMKLLENRTKQSKNEIELLESLEELKDLNRRQQVVDYETMLMAYDDSISEREREERLQQLDEEYIKSVKFESNRKRKVVVEEEIIEEAAERKLDSSIEENTASNTTTNTQTASKSEENDTVFSCGSWSKDKNLSKIQSKKSKSLMGLVRVKTDRNSEQLTHPLGNNSCGSKSENSSNERTENMAKPTPSGLLLLGSYSDSDEGDGAQ